MQAVRVHSDLAEGAYTLIVLGGPLRADASRRDASVCARKFAARCSPLSEALLEAPINAAPVARRCAAVLGVIAVRLALLLRPRPFAAFAFDAAPPAAAALDDELLEKLLDDDDDAAAAG